MADIVFRYKEMRQAAADIKELAGRYKTAATTLESDFISAISGWEGESKEALQKFISGSFSTYTRDTVPQLLEGLADLLTANIDQMQSADHQIAESIPT